MSCRNPHRRIVLFVLGALSVGSWALVGASSRDARGRGPRPDAGWCGVAVEWIVDHQDVDDREEDDDRDDPFLSAPAWTGTSLSPTATGLTDPAWRPPDRVGPGHGPVRRRGPPLRRSPA